MKAYYDVYLRAVDGSGPSVPLGVYQAFTDSGAMMEALKDRPGLREKLHNGSYELAAKPALVGP